MAKAKSKTLSKAAKPKAAGKAKAAPKKSASKLAKAASNVMSALTPKKAQSPSQIKAPAAAPTPKPAKVSPPPAAPAADGHSSWSDSLRRAMQEKNSQRHWPENKQDWKDRQRAGLSISQRNKFG